MVLSSSFQVAVVAVGAVAPLHLEMVGAVVPLHRLQNLQAELLLGAAGPDLHQSVREHQLLEALLL